MDRGLAYQGPVALSGSACRFTAFLHRSHSVSQSQSCVESFCGISEFTAPDWMSGNMSVAVSFVISCQISGCVRRVGMLCIGCIDWGGCVRDVGVNGEGWRM